MESGGSQSDDWCPRKEGGQPCEWGLEGLGHSPGMPGVTRTWKGQDGPSPDTSGETKAPHTLLLEFWPPET